VQLPENRDDSPRESAGADFVKKIGVLGAILFLLLSIIATILMFTINLPAQPINEEPETSEQNTQMFPTVVSYYCAFPPQPF